MPRRHPFSQPARDQRFRAVESGPVPVGRTTWVVGLKWVGQRAEAAFVRFERLVIEAGSNTFTLDLHPSLTVVTGVGRLEREGLVNELIGALGPSRSGVHAEIVADNGHRFALFRPSGARHRVIDIDRSVDVTDRFRNADGNIDILGLRGLDVRSAKRKLRVTAADVTTGAHSDELVARLARTDQAALWRAADRLRRAEESLQMEAEAAGSAPEDAMVVEQIEARHHEFMSAQSLAERFRKLSFGLGAIAALSAVPLSMKIGPIASGPLLILAAVVTLLSFRQWKRMEEAEAREAEALALAGAQSYLGFHLQRVNGLLDNDQSRRRLLHAAEDQRAARVSWVALAGEIDVQWALEHRDRIEALSRKVGAEDSLPVFADPATSDIARALLARIQGAATLGPGGEQLPVIIDDALADVDAAQKPALLELLMQASMSQQIIVLTEDERVASWARLERMTGALSVLEPSPEPAGAGKA
jgi:hypothetical protein